MSYPLMGLAILLTSDAAAQEKAVRILTLGDGLTKGGCGYALDNIEHPQDAARVAGYREYLFEKLRNDYGSGRFVAVGSEYDCGSHDGYKKDRGACRHLLSIVRMSVEATDPDQVVVMCGLMDLLFRMPDSGDPGLQVGQHLVQVALGNLKRLLRKIIQMRPKTSLIVSKVPNVMEGICTLCAPPNCTTPCYPGINEHIREFNQGLEDYAKSKEGHFVLSDANMETWKVEDFDSAGIFRSVGGYQKLARSLFDPVAKELHRMDDEADDEESENPEEEEKEMLRSLSKDRRSAEVGALVILFVACVGVATMGCLKIKKTQRQTMARNTILGNESMFGSGARPMTEMSSRSIASSSSSPRSPKRGGR